MTEYPSVSVITIAYNSSKFIKETIASILDQEYINFEILIGDDCSTDDTWDVIQQFKDQRIRSFRNEKNIGEYSNRNRCVQLAKGEYLIFIDGDDIMYPHALKTFIHYASVFPECAIIIARDWDYRIRYPYKLSPADFYRFEYFDASILGNFSKILFKTSIIKKEPFPVNIKTGDTYIQMKLCQKYPALIIPDGLTWWRRRLGNATQELFRNYRYHAETINYRLELLTNNCPLSALEIEIAKRNIYGFYMRMLIRLFLKLEIQDAIYLIKRIKVPKRYLKSIFYARKVALFKHITGDQPFHSISQ